MLYCIIGQNLKTYAPTTTTPTATTAALNLRTSNMEGCFVAQWAEIEQTLQVLDNFYITSAVH